MFYDFSSAFSTIQPHLLADKLMQHKNIRAVLEIILGGAQTLFCPVGGGCFVDSVSEGWGWVGSNLSWGSRHI